MKKRGTEQHPSLFFSVPPENAQYTEKETGKNKNLPANKNHFPRDENRFP
jgi:hypothetical protein